LLLIKLCVEKHTTIVHLKKTLRSSMHQPMADRPWDKEERMRGDKTKQ